MVQSNLTDWASIPEDRWKYFEFVVSTNKKRALRGFIIGFFNNIWYLLSKEVIRNT